MFGRLLALLLAGSLAFTPLPAYAADCTEIEQAELEQTYPKSLVKRVYNFVWSEALTLAPAVLVPLAWFAGGNITQAAIAAVELAFALKMLDLSVDFFLAQAERIVPQRFFLGVAAGFTNAGEAGAATSSAVVSRDPLAEVGSAPLGSNPANFLLGGAALLVSLKSIALQKEVIKPGERFTLSKAMETVRKLDRKAMLRPAGTTLLLAGDALAFRYVVQPQLKAGNYLPMAAWVTLNLPFLARYLYKNFVDRTGMAKNAIDAVTSAELAAMREALGSNNAELGEGRAAARKMLEVVKKVEALKGQEQLNPKDARGEVKEVLDQFKAIRDTLLKDKRLEAAVAHAVRESSAPNLKLLLEMAGLKGAVVEQLSMAEKVKVISKMVAGIVAVAALSTVLDDGIERIPDALPYMDKSGAGFFIMSLLSSFPEFFVSRRLFSVGRQGEAVTNMAHSNVFNIILAKMAMSASWFTNWIDDEEIEIPEETDSDSE